MSLSVRAAQISDLPAVLALVRGMFVDLGTPDFHPSWAKDVTDALRDRMGRDVAVSVAVDGTNIIAVAVGLVEQRLPSPRRPSGRIGYIEWLATDPRHRRRGAARLAMEDLLAWFEAQEVRLVDVHASAAARTLYEQFGFEPPTASALRWRG